MPGFSHPGAPEVRLGALADGGLAPAIMAIVERGVTRRPEQARALMLKVELRMEERYPPVRIAVAGAPRSGCSPPAGCGSRVASG